MGSMKSQFKKADASGARFALIFGEQELHQASVAVKPLRGPRLDGDAAPHDAVQRLLPIGDVANWAASLRHI
jgi:histidyl-tRNA synthetase